MLVSVVLQHTTTVLVTSRGGVHLEETLCPASLSSGSNEDSTWEKEGHAVAQLVEALRYKSEGCGFDWNFSLT